MILTPLGPAAPFFRAFVPKWAHAPSLAGGRFNRSGLEVRYRAADAETALAEYQGESPLLQPAKLVTFLVTARAVVDLAGGYDAERWTHI